MKVSALACAAVLVLSSCGGPTTSSRASGSTSTTASTGDAPPRTAEADDYPIGDPLGSDTTLSVGERRSLIVNLHCGMSPLVDFNGDQWALAETPAGPVPNTGGGEPIPPGWPRESPESVPAYVSLGDDDTIRYSLPTGVVIAVYRRAPAPTQVAGCD